MSPTISQDIYKRFDVAWWTLKLTYGLLFIVAGADKFLNIITDWEKYLSPYVLEYVPFAPMHIIYLMGIIEILLGILILTRTYIGAYSAAGLLVFISLNLVSMHYFDIAVRDTVMAIGALVLAQLTLIKDEIS